MFLLQSVGKSRRPRLGRGIHRSELKHKMYLSYFPVKMLTGACTDVIEKSLRQKKQYPPFLYDSI